MERKDELTVLIKSLFFRVKILFRDSMDLENEDVIIAAAKQIRSLSIQITKYSQELEEIVNS